jgi:hypothetical protein
MHLSRAYLLRPTIYLSRADLDRLRAAELRELESEERDDDRPAKPPDESSDADADPAQAWAERLVNHSFARMCNHGFTRMCTDERHSPYPWSSV